MIRSKPQPRIHLTVIGAWSYARTAIAVVAAVCLSNIAFAQTSHFTFTSGTGSNATVVVPTSANPNIAGTPLASGDEIGVFTPGGLCVGGGVWNNSNIAIAVWGASTLPVMPGIQPGEAMSYHIWRKSSNTEFSSVAVSYSSVLPATQWDGLYQQDAICVLTSLSATAGPASKYIVSSSNNSPAAGTAVTIKAQLTDANNLPVSIAGKTVTWSSTNGGSFGTPTTSTDASGVATVSFTTSSTVGTIHAVTATDNTGLTGTSSNITTVGGSATKLVFLQQPTNAFTGSSISPAITVQIQDASGNLVSTDTRNVTLAIGNNPGGGSLSGVATVAAVAGVATFSNLSINNAGTGYTLSATSSPALTGATSASFNITAGAATKLGFGQQPSNTAMGASISPAITVQIQDAGGNLVSSDARNVTLVIGNNPGGGSLSGVATVAAIGGVATFSNLSITKAGTGYTLSATSSPALTGATSASFNITAGAATKLGFGQQPSNTAMGASISPAITVQIQDANGNLVTADTRNVTLAIGANPGGGSLSGTATVAAVAGVATFSDLSINNVGTGYTLGATSYPSLIGATSSTFNITAAGVPTQYLVTSSAISPSAGSTVTITAQLVDAYDNPVSIAGKTVTWSKTGAGGSFGSPTSLTSSSGAATVGFTVGTVQGTTYTVTATDNTGLTGTSPNVLAIPGPEAKYLVTSNNYGPAAGTNVTITAQLTDAFSNAVSTAGKTVTWSSTNGGSFGVPTSTTNSSGVAAVVFTSSSVSGTTHTVTATDNTGLKGTSPNITTVVSRPSVPTPLSPSYGAVGLALNPTLRWSSSPGATSYNVQVSDTSGFLPPLRVSQSVSDISLGIVGLNYKIKYYWRVSATNASGTSAYSTPYVFTTQLSPVPPPAAPDLSQPADGATGVPTAAPITWLASGNATIYHLQIAENVMFTPTIFDMTNVNGFGAMVALRASTTYFWRVSAIDWYGAEGPFSTVRTFSTAGTTGIEPISQGVPSEFVLHQNYPNPFNPSTMIRFEVAAQSRVQMKIYNVFGQEIAILVDEILRPGSYERPWTAGVASGVYFCRFEAVAVGSPETHFISVRKMTVIK